MLNTIKVYLFAAILNTSIAYGGIFDIGKQLINEVVGQPPQNVLVLSEREALQLFDNFRSQKIYGDYSFVFELQHMPRQSRGSLFFGMIWGTWGKEGEGPLMRMELWPANKKEDRIILLGASGEHPKVWTLDKNVSAGYRELTAEEIFKPVRQDLLFSPFELFFNYLYWKNPEYLGSTVAKGRPAQAYRLEAPNWVKKVEKEYTSVDVYLDAEYGALIEAYILGKDKRVEKAIKVLNFKKVQNQWIVKTIDLMDEISRDKSRLDIRRAALNLKFDKSYFKPGKLTEHFPRIPENAYTVL